MLNQLLETIIQILTGWVNQFTSHAQHVEDKLDSLDQTASDIETNTEPISDIKDNTGAVITPIQSIKANTDSIATSSQTSANNTTAILNNIGTLSTNTGRAAAYAQDCANNTLDIKDKITTIASDTTQLRADSANIAADVSSINQAIGYYIANTLVTEDSEGALCNFETDLEDYLQKAVVTIPADINGFSSININKVGKNLSILNSSTLDNSQRLTINNSDNNNINYVVTETYARAMYKISLKAGVTVTISFNGKGLPNGYNRITFNKTNSYGHYSPYGGFIITDQAVNYTKTLTLTSDDLYIGFYWNSDTTSSGTAEIRNFQIEINDSATPYEPYKVITYPVSFGSTITDGAEADLLSGLVKVNTTPETFIQIQPIAVRTYKGVNNIYSDVGTSALTYRETLKHYLAKNNQ